MSHVTCHISNGTLFLRGDKVLKLFDGGVLSTGPTLYSVRGSHVVYDPLIKYESQTAKKDKQPIWTKIYPHMRIVAPMP